MSCPKCGCTGIHACPGHPMPAWTQELRREFERVLRRYETPASRNQREGRYCGTYRGKPIRSQVFAVVNKHAARIEGVTRGALRRARNVDAVIAASGLAELGQLVQPPRTPGWRL